MKDNSSEFETAKKYRTLSFGAFVLSALFVALVKGDYIAKWLGYGFFVVTFCIAIFLSMQYKCPVCKATFDTRVSPSKLRNCPNCGANLHA